MVTHWAIENLAHVGIDMGGRRRDIKTKRATSKMLAARMLYEAWLWSIGFWFLPDRTTTGDNNMGGQRRGFDGQWGGK